MKKIIALLCCLVVFSCIGGACSPNKTEESTSVNTQSSPTTSENPGSSSVKDPSKDEETEDTSKDEEKEEYFTVTFDSDGGTLVAEQRVSKGEKIEKPDDPKKASTETIDFEFIGWYADEVEWDFDKNTVEKDIILRAKWQEKKYSVDLPI